MKDAGIKACYSNENYETSGASIVDSLPNNTSIVTSLNAFYDHSSNHIENSIIISLTDIRTNSEIKKFVKIKNYLYLQWNLFPELQELKN